MGEPGSRVNERYHHIVSVRFGVPGKGCLNVWTDSIALQVQLVEIPKCPILKMGVRRDGGRFDEEVRFGCLHQTASLIRIDELTGLCPGRDLDHLNSGEPMEVS